MYLVTDIEISVSCRLAVYRSGKNKIT